MARKRSDERSGGGMVKTVLFLVAAAGVGVAAVHYLAPEHVSAQLHRIHELLGM